MKDIYKMHVLGLEVPFQRELSKHDNILKYESQENIAN